MDMRTAHSGRRVSLAEANLPILVIVIGVLSVLFGGLSHFYESDGATGKFIYDLGSGGILIWAGIAWLREKERKKRTMRLLAEAARSREE